MCQECTKSQETSEPENVYTGGTSFPDGITIKESSPVQRALNENAKTIEALAAEVNVLQGSLTPVLNQDAGAGPDDTNATREQLGSSQHAKQIIEQNNSLVKIVDQLRSLRARLEV